MKLSVLLPVYNGEEHLERAIKSILGQDFADFEFIIIDDASEDRSPDIIRKAAARDSRIKVVTHSRNMGISATLNEGLQIASAPYVVRMDHDDESLPQRLGIQHTFMHSRPEIAAAGSFVLHMGIIPEMDRLVRLPATPAEVKAALPKENCLYHPSMIINRKVALDAGGYRPQFGNAEDYDLWLRLSRHHDLANIPVPLLRYRFTIGGLSLGSKWKQLYHTLLAQAAFRAPDADMAETEWITDELHRSMDKRKFLANVLRDTTRELLNLGRCDEARLLMERFTEDLGEQKVRQVFESLSTTPCAYGLFSGHGSLAEFSAPDLETLSNGVSLGNQRGRDTGEKVPEIFRPKETDRHFMGRLRWPEFGVLRSKNAGQRRNRSSLLSALGMLAMLLPGFYWAIRDRHVWPWDPSWYGEVSVDLWFKLTHHFSEWLPAMLHAFGIKAPGIAWLGQFFVPLGVKAGSIETGLLCSIFAVQLGSLILIFRLGKFFAPHRRIVAWAGVLVYAGAPLFVAMSHQYFVEALQLFGVTYFYFLAAKAREMSRVKLCGNLLLATSIALLAKVTSPLYCLLPSLMAVWSLFPKREVESRRKRRLFFACILVVVGIILMAGCVAWYAINFQAVREFASLSSSGEIALAYGSKATFLHKLGYWLRASQTSFGLPMVMAGQSILLAAGLAFSRLKRGTLGKIPRAQRNTASLLALFSLVHIVGVVSLFSVSINEENRYLLPLLPAIATVVLWMLARVRHHRIIALIIALACCQWGIVYAQALRLLPRNDRLSYWLYPYQTDTTGRDEIERLVARTSTAQTAGRYNIVGVEVPWLNANTLSFYAAKHELKTGTRCAYTFLGYAENDESKAWKRLESFNIVYFITLDEASQAGHRDLFNQVSSLILQRIRGDNNFVQEPFDSKQGVILFYNNGPEQAYK